MLKKNKKTKEKSCIMILLHFQEKNKKYFVSQLPHELGFHIHDIPSQVVLISTIKMHPA